MDFQLSFKLKLSLAIPLILLFPSIYSSESTIQLSDQTPSKAVSQLKNPASLYKFFGIFNLQGLSHDLRKKLIPYCFCGSIERKPLWEHIITEEEDHFGSVAFSDDGKQLAYSRGKQSTLLDLTTFDTRELEEIDYAVDALAFDGSTLACMYPHGPDGDKFLLQSINGTKSSAELVPEDKIKDKVHIVACIYDGEGRLIGVDFRQKVIIFDPKDGSQELFHKELPFCVQCQKKDGAAFCVNKSTIAFLHTHNILDFFSITDKKWTTSFTVFGGIHPELAFNEDGTLLLVLGSQDKLSDGGTDIVYTKEYGYNERSDRYSLYIMIVECATGNIMDTILLGRSSPDITQFTDDARGTIQGANFLVNSQCILLLYDYVTILVHRETGAIIAKYPHGPRDWYYYDDNGKWERDHQDEDKAQGDELWHFSARKQYMSPTGNGFATLANRHLKLYALPLYVEMIFDQDKDRGGLERILFIQYLRIISQLGLRIGATGIEIQPWVMKWGKNVPAILEKKLRESDIYNVNVDELKALFETFSPHLQKHLKTQYHLPWPLARASHL